MFGGKPSTYRATASPASITLESSVWNVSLDFRIVGEIPRDGSPVVWIHREYLDQALQAAGGGGLGVAGLVWVRAASGESTQAVMDAIDDLTRRTDSPTTQQTEKSFFASFMGSLQGLLSVILAVTALVALCIVFIAANTASLSIRERAGEIALMKALGFGRRRIFALLLAAIFSTIGGLIGGAVFKVQSPPPAPPTQQTPTPPGNAPTV